MSTRTPGPLVLLRHGESTANASGLFTGILDAPLSDQGAAEARSAAELLSAANLHPDVVFTSSLQRARRTAEILAEEPAPPPRGPAGRLAAQRAQLRRPDRSFEGRRACGIR
ncbi:histidine phosphatase family protein [Cryobacterium breve]|uniref:histidine phosphatase family protein n=1 Tax=Cryobacterium breve TaxID=1259258 RepID=UPI00248CE483|nr:histidine phosphatase family protein [Cryobacterium breve]